MSSFMVTSGREGVESDGESTQLKEWCTNNRIPDYIIEQLLKDDATLADLCDFSLDGLKKLLTQLKVDNILHRSRFISAVQKLPNAQCSDNNINKQPKMTEAGRKCVDELRSLSNDISNGIESIELTIDDVNKAALESSDAIKTSFSGLIELIEKRQQILLTQVSTLQQSKTERLTQQLNRIQSIGNQISDALKQFKSTSESNDIDTTQRETAISNALKNATIAVSNEATLSGLPLTVQPCVNSDIQFETNILKLEQCLKDNFQIKRPKQESISVSPPLRPFFPRKPRNTRGVPRCKAKGRDRNRRNARGGGYQTYSVEPPRKPNRQTDRERNYDYNEAQQRPNYPRQSHYSSQEQFGRTQDFRGMQPPQQHSQQQLFRSQLPPQQQPMMIPPQQRIPQQPPMAARQAYQSLQQMPVTQQQQRRPDTQQQHSSQEQFGRTQDLRHMTQQRSPQQQRTHQRFSSLRQERPMAQQHSNPPPDNVVDSIFDPY